jgi:hypothetical protein
LLNMLTARVERAVKGGLPEWRKDKGLRRGSKLSFALPPNQPSYYRRVEGRRDCPFQLSPLAKFIAPIINATTRVIHPPHISRLNTVETAWPTLGGYEGITVIGASASNNPPSFCLSFFKPPTRSKAPAKKIPGIHHRNQPPHTSRRRLQAS